MENVMIKQWFCFFHDLQTSHKVSGFAGILGTYIRLMIILMLKSIVNHGSMQLRRWSPGALPGESHRHCCPMTSVLRRDLPTGYGVKYSSRFVARTARTQGIGQRGKKRGQVAPSWTPRWSCTRLTDWSIRITRCYTTTPTPSVRADLVMNDGVFCHDYPWLISRQWTV